ncbi:unnamed protein product, partial [Sphagnum jensenii]
MKLLRFVSGFKSHQHRRCWWWLHSPKEWSRCLQTIFGYFGLLSYATSSRSVGLLLDQLRYFEDFGEGFRQLLLL